MSMPVDGSRYVRLEFGAVLLFEEKDRAIDAIAVRVAVPSNGKRIGTNQATFTIHPDTRNGRVRKAAFSFEFEAPFVEDSVMAVSLSVDESRASVTWEVLPATPSDASSGSSRPRRPYRDLPSGNPGLDTRLRRDSTRSGAGSAQVGQRDGDVCV
jgi:hypothetical protein